MMQLPGFARSRTFLLTAALALILVFGFAAWRTLHPRSETLAMAQSLPRIESSRSFVPRPVPAGPPWRYGQPEARFTVIEYADLECPFCRTYFPVLKRWIDGHPEVNWQWHHLPLAMHEPAASAEARLVECIGESGGANAFWQAVEWVYAHTRGDGQGLPKGLRYPNLKPEAQQCLDSDRPDAAIRAQAAEAEKNGIAATPALQLRDRETGKTLLLHGPVEGDALLSALDLLAASATAEPTLKEMPADPVGDMPR
jgi:hypothetical protein